MPCDDDDLDFVAAFDDEDDEDDEDDDFDPESTLAAAEAGDLDAMYAAYRLYAAGRGVTRNVPQALAWLRRAAEAGHLTSILCLAGELDSQPEALEWYTRAIELGSGEAAAGLGWSYEQGRGLPAPDPERAVAFYKRAIELGVTEVGPQPLAPRIARLERAIAAAAARGGRPPTVEEALTEAIVDHELTAYQDKLFAALRPSIRLVEGSPTPDAELPVGASKLGGAPDLAADTPWPVSASGRPLEFVAQLDLAAIAAAANFDTGLPTNGLLAAFYDVEQMPWGFADEEEGGFAVLHVTGPLVRRDVPEGAEAIAAAPLTPTVEVTLPFWRTIEARELGIADEDYERYMDLQDALPAAMGERHRVLGHPDATQGDMRRRLVYDAAGADLDVEREDLEAQARELVLLLQLSSFWFASLLWGDDGRLFFWIDRSALARGDFSAVRLQLQS